MYFNNNELQASKVSVLITGATGFLGRNLLNYLDDFNVNVLGRDDLLKELNFADNNAIIHLAGKAHDLKKTSNSDEYYKTNFELTKKLYNAFLKSEARRFVFISSVKAVTDVADGILTEECYPNPQTHYGKSKLMAEQYIKAQILPKDKSYYILRPCMIHGPGNKGNLNLLYNLVSKGFPYPFAAFENRRSFLSVENLCFVIKKILTNDIEPGIYNVADDESLSTNDVIKILAHSSNKKANLWKISPTFVRLIAKIGDKIGFLLNTDRLDKLTGNFIVSNEKIKDAIHSSLPLSTREGLLIPHTHLMRNNTERIYRII